MEPASSRFGTDFNRRIENEPSDRDLQEDYQDHFMTMMGNLGRDFGFYEPAYRYGRHLAEAHDNRDRDWDEIEMDDRSRWEEENHGPWSDFREAVQHAYNRARTVPRE